MPRLFVAVPIDSPEVGAAAEGVGRSLGRLSGVKWVPAHQLHFTLKFLGEVGEEGVAAAKGAVEEAVRGQRAFGLALAGLGTFPPHRPARVVWVGCATGGEELVTLAGRVEAAFQAAGFPPDERPFRPHLTLGRVKDERMGRQVSRAVEERAATPLGAFLASRVVLYQSVLSPQGPTHTVLAAERLVESGD